MGTMYAIGLSILTFAAFAYAEQSKAQSLETLLNSTSELSNLTKTLGNLPDLLAVVGNATNVTILAPSDSAFRDFSNMSASNPVMNDSSVLKNVLSYHVLNGTYHRRDWQSNPNFLPTYLGDAPQFKNLSGSPQVVEVIGKDGNSTAITGLGLKSNITRADIDFDGGVLHIMDRLLTPPMNVSTTAAVMGLTSLSDALENLNSTAAVDALSKVTIFAPSDDAFHAISRRDAIENLNPNDIVSILNYHIVPNTLGYTPTLHNDTKLRTVHGGELTIRTEDNGTVFVNQARVVKPNIIVNSGVMHVIDSVLNPNSTNSTLVSTTSTQSTASSSESSGSAAPSTSPEPTVTEVVGGGGGSNTGGSETSTSAEPTGTEHGDVGKVGWSRAAVGVAAGVFVCRMAVA